MDVSRVQRFIQTGPFTHVKCGQAFVYDLGSHSGQPDFNIYMVHVQLITFGPEDMCATYEKNIVLRHMLQHSSSTIFRHAGVRFPSTKRSATDGAHALV